MLGQQPASLRFRACAHAASLSWIRPPLAMAGRRLRFNVSHSSDLAVIAVCQGRELGVDLEQLRSIGEAERIVESFFSAGEQAEFASIASEARAMAFLRGWTRKEAILKGLGVGIAGLADQHETGFGTGEMPVRFTPAVPCSRVGEWQLWEASPRAGFVATVACLLDPAAQFFRVGEAAAVQVMSGSLSRFRRGTRTLRGDHAESKSSIPWIVILGVIVLAIYVVIRLMTNVSAWMTGRGIGRIGSLLRGIRGATKREGFLNRRQSASHTMVRQSGSGWRRRSRASRARFPARASSRGSAMEFRSEWSWRRSPVRLLRSRPGRRVRWRRVTRSSTTDSWFEPTTLRCPATS